MTHNNSKECKGAAIDTITYESKCGMCITCKNEKHLKLVLKLHCKICEFCTLQNKIITHNSLRQNNYK